MRAKDGGFFLGDECRCAAVAALSGEVSGHFGGQSRSVPGCSVTLGQSFWWRRPSEVRNGGFLGLERVDRVVMAGRWRVHEGSGESLSLIHI